MARGLRQVDSPEPIEENRLESRFPTHDDNSVDSWLQRVSPHESSEIPSHEYPVDPQQGTFDDSRHQPLSPDDHKIGPTRREHIDSPASGVSSNNEILPASELDPGGASPRQQAFHGSIGRMSPETSDDGSVHGNTESLPRENSLVDSTGISPRHDEAFERKSVVVDNDEADLRHATLPASPVETLGHEYSPVIAETNMSSVDAPTELERTPQPGITPIEDLYHSGDERQDNLGGGQPNGGRIVDNENNKHDGDASIDATSPAHDIESILGDYHDAGPGQGDALSTSWHTDHGIHNDNEQAQSAHEEPPGASLESNSSPMTPSFEPEPPFEQAGHHDSAPMGFEESDIPANGDRYLEDELHIPAASHAAPDGFEDRYGVGDYPQDDSHSIREGPQDEDTGYDRLGPIDHYAGEEPPYQESGENLGSPQAELTPVADPEGGDDMWRGEPDHSGGDRGMFVGGQDEDGILGAHEQSDIGTDFNDSHDAEMMTGQMQGSDFPHESHQDWSEEPSHGPEDGAWDHEPESETGHGTNGDQEIGGLAPGSFDDGHGAGMSDFDEGPQESFHGPGDEPAWDQSPELEAGYGGDQDIGGFEPEPFDEGHGAGAGGFGEGPDYDEGLPGIEDQFQHDYSPSYAGEEGGDMTFGQGGDMAFGGGEDTDFGRDGDMDLGEGGDMNFEGGGPRELGPDFDDQFNAEEFGPGPEENFDGLDVDRLSNAEEENRGLDFEEGDPHEFGPETDAGFDSEHHTDDGMNEFDLDGPGNGQLEHGGSEFDFEEDPGLDGLDQAEDEPLSEAEPFGEDADRELFGFETGPEGDAVFSDAEDGSQDGEEDFLDNYGTDDDAGPENEESQLGDDGVTEGATNGDGNTVLGDRELDMEDLYEGDVPSVPVSPIEVQDESFASNAMIHDEQPTGLDSTNPVHLSTMYAQSPILSPLDSPSLVAPTGNTTAETGVESEVDPTHQQPVRFSCLYRQSIDWGQALDSPFLDELTAEDPVDVEGPSFTAPILEAVPESAKRASQPYSHTLAQVPEQMTPITASPLSPRPPATPPPDSADKSPYHTNPLSPRDQPTPPPESKEAQGRERCGSGGPQTFDEMNLATQPGSQHEDYDGEPARVSSIDIRSLDAHRRKLSQRFSGWWAGGASAGPSRNRTPPPPLPYDSRYGEGSGSPF